MNKTELEMSIIERSRINRDIVSEVVGHFIDLLVENLANGNPVRITGFGTLDVKDRKERQGKNPKTGEPITIAASRKVVIRPGKNLSRAVNEGLK